MATELSLHSDLDAFKQYVDEYHCGRLNGLSLAEAIASFRKHEEQVTALRRKLEKAEASETVVFTDAVVAERYAQLDAQLADEGIVE